MATEFRMPKLGLTMEEGTITEWLVDEGAEVTAGTPVLRIETDKTETDVEAAASGRLHLVGDVGDTYACGELIGWFLANDEAAPDGDAAPAPAAKGSPGGSATGSSSTTAAAPADGAPADRSGGRVIASPNARRIAAERGIDLRSVHGTGPNGRILSEDLEGVTPAGAPPTAAPVAPAAAGAATSVGATRPATAAARQLADLLGIDLSVVAPVEGDGRVTREAVARHVRELLAPGAAPSRAPAMEIPLSQTPSEVLPLTGMRGTIARRMHQSLQEMAQLTLFLDADLDAVVADRSERARTGTAPGYTDYVIAAVARALLRHPRLNAQVTAEGIAVLPAVHVGMAVALDDGLVVPVVRDTPARDLSSLSAETSRLADAARSGAVTLPELEGGTFSVTTLGMFGVDGFTPVVNPPNAAILGVGRLREELVLVDGGGVGTTTRVTLSLTWDHRVVDGAPAAEFCRTVAELLREPAALDRPVT